MKVLGIGLINNNSYEFELCEYEDDDQFSILQSLIVSKGIKSCIFKCVNEKRHERLLQNFKILLQKCNVKAENISSFNNFITTDDSDSSQRLIDINLQQLLTKKDSKRLLTFTDHRFAKCALNFIIYYQELIGNEHAGQRFSIRELRLKQFMKLDAAAMAALNLFPTVQDSLNS